jgi:hypothetical protein
MRGDALFLGYPARSIQFDIVALAVAEAQGMRSVTVSAGKGEYRGGV